MAIFHTHVAAVSRAIGQTSVASSAYLSRSRMVDPRTGATYDYTRAHRHERIVADLGVTLPEGAAPELADRARLWGTVERSERSAKACVARTVECALPDEMTDTQRARLARRLIAWWAAQGVAVDAAEHAAADAARPANHHLHMQVTSRRVGPKGLMPKSTNVYEVRDQNGRERDVTTAEWPAAKAQGFEKIYRYRLAGEDRWLTPSEAERWEGCTRVKRNARQHTRYLDGFSDQGLVERWREALEEITNDELLRDGYPSRIDRRSLAEQGVERMPTVHEGTAVSEIERRHGGGRPVTERRRTNDRIRHLNALNAEADRLAQERAEVEAAIGGARRMERWRAEAKAASRAATRRKAAAYEPPSARRQQGRAAQDLRQRRRQEDALIEPSRRRELAAAYAAAKRAGASQELVAQMRAAERAIKRSARRAVAATGTGGNADRAYDLARRDLRREVGKLTEMMATAPEAVRQHAGAFGATLDVPTLAAARAQRRGALEAEASARAELARAERARDQIMAKLGQDGRALASRWADTGCSARRYDLLWAYYGQQGQEARWVLAARRRAQEAQGGAISSFFLDLAVTRRVAEDPELLRLVQPLLEARWPGRARWDQAQVAAAVAEAVGGESVRAARESWLASVDAMARAEAAMARAEDRDRELRRLQAEEAERQRREQERREQEAREREGAMAREAAPAKPGPIPALGPRPAGPAKPRRMAKPAPEPEPVDTELAALLAEAARLAEDTKARVAASRRFTIEPEPAPASMPKAPAPARPGRRSSGDTPKAQPKPPAPTPAEEGASPYVPTSQAALFASVHRAAQRQEGPGRDPRRPQQ